EPSVITVFFAVSAGWFPNAIAPYVAWRSKYVATPLSDACAATTFEVAPRCRLELGTSTLISPVEQLPPLALPYDVPFTHREMSLSIVPVRWRPHAVAGRANVLWR